MTVAGEIPQGQGEEGEQRRKGRDKKREEGQRRKEGRERRKRARRKKRDMVTEPSYAIKVN